MTELRKLIHLAKTGTCGAVYPRYCKKDCPIFNECKESLEYFSKKKLINSIQVIIENKKDLAMYALKRKYKDEDIFNELL